MRVSSATEHEHLVHDARSVNLEGFAAHPIALEAHPFIQSDRPRVDVEDAQLDAVHAELIESDRKSLPHHRGAEAAALGVRVDEDTPDTERAVPAIDRTQLDVAAHLSGLRFHRFENQPVCLCDALLHVLEDVLARQRKSEAGRRPAEKLILRADPSDQAINVFFCEGNEIDHDPR